MTIIKPFCDIPLQDAIAVLSEGEPYIRIRGETDYWAYGHFFGTTCIAATVDGAVAGILLSFINQDNTKELYIQDIAVAQKYRHLGTATTLLQYIEQVARNRGCTRIWLTSEPDNLIAINLWRKEGYFNLPTDIKDGDLWITKDLKGPGKHRAVFEKHLELR